MDIRSTYNAGTATDIPRLEFLSDTIHPSIVGKGIIGGIVAKAIKLNGWVK